MGYEIDYLAVGEGKKNGDAICLRYGNLCGGRDEQIVITIDGGTRESGDAIVGHVKNYYATDFVNIALLTHPDTDHASGMRQILEGLRVGQVVMHLPWNHSAAVRSLLEDRNVTTNAIREKTQKNLATAREIEQLAQAKGIPVVEPFAGQTNYQGLLVLGPTVDFYREMLAGFDFMPRDEVQSASQKLAERLRGIGQRAVSSIAENWFSESLGEPAMDASSPENNSSVIFLLEVSGHKLLFTGDAGVPALHAAADFAARTQVSLSGLRFFDVPHHGSRRNLGPSILNRLFGDIRLQDARDWTAYISAAMDGAPKHPHKKVTNALRRRGAAVYVTAGRNICHHHNAPDRVGWTAIDSLPLYTQVEDDE